MAELTARAQSASNAIRAHSHPILETGNLSYPNGFYAVDFRPGANRSSFRIAHRVEGAPLISRLLRDGAAKCICTISSPVSAFRDTLVSDTRIQTVSWNPDDLGEPPLFTPMVVATEPLALELDADREGTHPAWNGVSIRLLKGSRLAIGPVIQLQSSPLHMLSIREDSNLSAGSFFVEAETEPFRFVAKVSPQLHTFLQRESGTHRYNIMAHIVTSCLRLLQESFAEETDEEGDWRSHRGLRALSDLLHSKGLAHWTDEGFRPEKVATYLYPLALPEPEEEV